MKPTQQDIIDLAREAGGGLSAIAEPLNHPWKFSQTELERFVALLLERFGAGAGGGEPVAWMYFESDGDAIFGHPNGYRPSDAVPVYTHPSPTDLQAVRDKALEDAAGICDRFQHRDVGMKPAECASAIRALKGKQ